MEQPIEKLVDTKEVLDFLVTARQFCSFIESTTKSGEGFMAESQHLLLHLYQLASNLPWTSLEHDEKFDDQLPKEEFEKILVSLSNKIGNERFYWDVFNPTLQEEKTEANCGDLVDDLGDIYRDIKYGLMIFDLGTMASCESAVWDFKFGLENHWGRHAVCAIKAMHFLVHKI